MSAADRYDIAGLDLSDDRYTVEQGLIRTEYAATDSTGAVVLRGKQNTFELKEAFPFTDGDGNHVVSVKASGTTDVAGRYVLSDAQTGADVVVLDNDYSILTDTWTVRDPESEAVLARISSRGALVTLARNVLPLSDPLPQRYEITDADGTHVGSIDASFSLKNRYEITVDDATTLPVEPVVAAAMILDAIKGFSHPEPCR